MNISTHIKELYYFLLSNHNLFAVLLFSISVIYIFVFQEEFSPQVLGAATDLNLEVKATLFEHILNSFISSVR